MQFKAFTVYVSTTDTLKSDRTQTDKRILTAIGRVILLNLAVSFAPTVFGEARGFLKIS